MKTAMQEHIEHLKIMQNMVKEKSFDADLTETINETLAGAIENAESFIKKEKQQIIDAAKYGQNNMSLSLKHEEEIAKNYYAKKFEKK